MRLRIVVIGMFAAILTACQGPPPTVVFVVTSTPEPGTEVTAEATPEVGETTIAVLPTTAPSTPVEVTLQVATAASAGGTASQTDLPPNFPTPIAVPIQYAEQLFENGRMFWLQPIGQIWVLVVTGEGEGTWSTYEDTYLEGEPESDPSLVPPEDNMQQPVRGFGKLWRTNQEVNDALGWAVNPEFGYVERYEYHAGGHVDASGQYTPVPEPGYHIIYSLYGERFRLNEDGTWVLGG